MIKICYFPIEDEEEIPRFDHFLHELCGLKFKTHELNLSIDDVETIAENGERPLRDFTK